MQRVLHIELPGGAYLRSKSVELKNQIYDYVNARKREIGTSPSLSEIGDQFGYNIKEDLIEKDVR